VVAEPAAEAFLANPSVSLDQVVDLLTDVLGDDTDATFKRFLEVLADNDRLSLLPEVTRLYAALREEAEKRLTVRVVSAVALEGEQAKRMSQALAKRFEREIELENEVDPAVLGGAVIYAGDEVIDGSVRGRLARLQNSLA
jgi:F-type H+-transporting ATPase subunit delta